MSTKIINICTAPNGEVFKRTSSSGRKYAYAVIAHRGDENWDVICWNSRLDLAQKALSQGSVYYHADAKNRKIVPVTVEEKTVKQGKRYERPADCFELHGLHFELDNGEYNCPDRWVATCRGWNLVLFWNETGFRARAERLEKILLPQVHTTYKGETYQNQDYHRCNIHPKGRGSAEQQVKKIKTLIYEKEAGH